MAYSIPERAASEEMTQATFRCTTRYFPLHPSPISSISRRHTVCASNAVKSATHKFRPHKYLRRYTRYVNTNTCPLLCPVSANTDASKRKQDGSTNFRENSPAPNFTERHCEIWRFYTHIERPADGRTQQFSLAVCINANKPTSTLWLCVCRWTEQRHNHALRCVFAVGWQKGYQQWQNKCESHSV